MIIKELRARGLARRVLILTPAGIQRQWQYELKTKFNEVFPIFNKATLAALKAENVLNPWQERHSVITSTTFASWTEARQRELAAVDWDLIVVDEAHHARRQRSGRTLRRTKLFDLVQELTARPESSRRATLFLTATPMQLQRHELFSLVEMLQPSLFSSETDFERHVQSLSELNWLVEKLESENALTTRETERVIDATSQLLNTTPLDVASQLGERRADLATSLRSKHRLSEVMIRNRRAVVGGFQPRQAYRWEVELTPEEVTVQEQMDAIIRSGYQTAATLRGSRASALGFLMVIYQKLAASSSRALKKSLERRCERLLDATDNPKSIQAIAEIEEDIESDDEVSEITARVQTALEHEAERLLEVLDLLSAVKVDSKARALVAHLQELFTEDPDSKVLIFTQFRETQEMLRELLLEQGWGAHIFHGQLTADEKDQAVNACRRGEGPQVLVLTEAGGEGRNMQFSHLLVNYDLPWNPMKVEQRIGRVDRTGQDHPVSVFNFHVKGTIEGRILDVLEHRIHLFEETVGKLEPILGNFESDIREALKKTAQKKAEQEEALERLSERVERKVVEAQKAERQMEDFVLDSRSDYSAEIAQIAQQRPATVEPEDFKRLIIELLRSVRTSIRTEDAALPGEYSIQFQPPFTEEASELLDGQERRRVALDPAVAIDAEHVEYLAFGHPIVERLVTRTTEGRYKGITAVRSISREPHPVGSPGVAIRMAHHGGRAPQGGICQIPVRGGLV